MQVGVVLLLEIYLFTIHPQAIAIGLDLRGIASEWRNMGVGGESPSATVAQRHIYLASLSRYGVACGIGDVAINALSSD